MSIKAVTGTMPVNLIFVAEGDEERMDIGLRKFVKDHPDLFKGAEALIGEGGAQNPSGSAGVGGGSEGCVYIELTTSGKAWGRGPVQSDIHGSNKRAVDSPAWRHIRMLASLVSPDGNTPLIKGFTDGIEPLSAEETAALKKAAEKTDMKTAAENVGVARYISDDPFTMLKMARYGVSFNLDGIWGGNMYAGGAGAILPNKITSKRTSSRMRTSVKEWRLYRCRSAWAEPGTAAMRTRPTSTTSSRAPGKCMAWRARRKSRRPSSTTLPARTERPQSRRIDVYSILPLGCVRGARA